MWNPACLCCPSPEMEAPDGGRGRALLPWVDRQAREAGRHGRTSPGMGRRTLLASAVAGSAIAALGGCAEGPALAGGSYVSPPADGPVTPREPPLPLRVEADPGPANIPLIDFHTHVQANLTTTAILPHMDAMGVARLVLMPLYYGDGGGAINDGRGSDEQAAEFARAHPGRFIPFIGMQRGELMESYRWHRPDGTAEALLLQTDAKLRSGRFFGMGEFMFRFYPYTTSLGIVAVSDMKFPPNSTLMHEFARLGARYRVPLVIHCEAEPDYAEQMRKLFAAHPDTPFVWSHNCGRSSASDIADIFTRYPNVSADLGAMMYTGGEGYGSAWPRATPWQHLIANRDGRLLPEMRDLFEKFPDRFLAGTDSAHARVYAFYPQRAQRWRLFLGQLSPETQRRIGFANAERLFRPTPAAALLDQSARQWA